MSQTTYSQTMPVAQTGMLDGIGPHTIASYAAEEVIPVAYPVMLGTDKEKEVLKATAAASAIGLALVNPATEQDSSGAVSYAATETVSVLKSGRMWVMTSDAVVAGATANMTVADGTLTDASVTTGIEAFTQFSAKFVTGTSAAGLAIVEIK